MAKKTGTRHPRKAAGARKAARASDRTRKTSRKTARKPGRTARKAPPKRAGRTPAKKPPAATAGRRKTAKKPSARTKKPSPARKKTSGAAQRRSKTAPRPRAGGTGRERELAQTPNAGRTVRGRTNPRPTRRSTGTPAGAGASRIPGLERERRQLRDVEEGIPTPPSSLDMDRHASAARSGRREMQQARHDHTESSPALTGGDIDADWEDAYAVGDEAPGGDNPTPDQDRVDDIGKALGIEYQDNEELKGSDKVAGRDRHRWELDPASSEDYRERKD